MIPARWQFPGVPLRASVLAANASGLMLIVALALMTRAGLHLGGSYPWKAAAVFGAIAVVTVGYVASHHPFPHFGLANQTTTARAILVAMVVALVGEPRISIVAGGAVVATLVVTALDGIDGWIARRRGMASDFGARFDMEIDALLTLALAALVWQHGKAGGWVLLSGLLRYLFVAGSWVLPWLKRPLPLCFRRRAICVVQILGLAVTLLPVVMPPVSNIISALALLSLLYSFLVDVTWLWQRRSAD